MATLTGRLLVVAARPAPLASSLGRRYFSLFRSTRARVNPGSNKKPSSYRYFEDPPHGVEGESASSSFSSSSSSSSSIFTKPRMIIGGLAGFGVLYYVTHLEPVPITGRTRFMNVSVKQEKEIGEDQYRSLLKQFQGMLLPPTDPRSVLVEQVGRKIVAVSPLRDQEFTFHVVNSPIANAFVVPGNKVFVFTGILPVMQNEDGMAMVLAHEISHQIARHGAEKLSFAQFLLASNILISLVIDIPHDFLRMIETFFLELPYSRNAESEADIIGLQLMAKACFDPEVGIEMFERLSKATGGDKKVNKYFSTHPHGADRVALLRKNIPDAKKAAFGDCSDVFHFKRSFSSVFGTEMKGPSPSSLSWR